MTESWAIHMHKEYFKFSCAHFLIFPDGSKERLHGHNYQIDCEIGGQLSAFGLVIDFTKAKPVVRALCDSLDEHWIIPGKHPELEYQHQDDGHCRIRYRDAHYLAPSDEVLVLPINNTSVENIATWFGTELLGRLRAAFGRDAVQRLRLSVSETSGQHGVYLYQEEGG